MSIKKLLLICFLVVAVLSFKEIRIRDRKLVDSEDREIRFHGTNVVVKVPPYLPKTDAYDPEWSFS